VTASSGAGGQRSAASPANSGVRRSVTSPDELTALEDYRRDVLARVTQMDPIELGLLEAHGCVLAQDVVATAELPAFANSAMDGYAVDSASVMHDEPIPLVAEAAAGRPMDGPLRPGDAARIMTGAPLPDGADAVVPVEHAEEADGTVTLHVTPRAGDHVRGAGEDVHAGTTVLTAGRRLSAADIGMLAAIGQSRVVAHPRPRVAVIATGDELVDPGVTLAPGQIYDSNSYTLTAMAREAGATAFRSNIVADNRRALSDAFEGALTNADILITSGGVSAGRYDFVKEVLAQVGDVSFHKVGMQPGMPQAFGFLGGEGPHRIPCFGLPGNPVSAFVSFEVLVRPALRRLQGRPDVNRPRVTAVLEEPVKSPPHKVSFLRVRLRRDGPRWLARLTGPQGSGLLHSAVAADGLAEVPADETKVDAGQTVVVHLLVAPQ
jgi:molybdopterin molybdotransferase